MFKITIIWCKKYWKDHVFKTWPSQNHSTMIHNKWTFFWFDVSLNHHTKLPKNIEIKRVLRTLMKYHPILWCQKNTDIFDFYLKSPSYDARKNRKNHVYLRRDRVKITILWCPKSRDIFDFKVKITIFCCPKILEKTYVLKMWMRQNHTTMIPKKYR